MINPKGAVVVLIAIVAMVHAGNFAPQDPDLGLHLAVGKIIAEEGQQPLEDRFTYTTEGTDFVNFEWAFDWATYALYDVGGGTALWFAKIVLLVLLVSLLFGLVHLFARGDPQNIPHARLWLLALLLLSIPVFRDRLVVRPHMIGYFMLLFHMLVVRLLVESKSRHHRGALGGLLVGTMPVWAAMHGSWPLAMGVTSLHFLVQKEARKTLAIVLFLELLVLLPNPHGLALLWVPFEHLAAAGGGPVPEEWMAPDLVLPNVHALIFYGCIMIFGLVLFFARNLRLAPEIILGLLLILMANKMARFVAPALLVILPLIAAGLAQWTGQIRERKRLVISGGAILVGLFSYVTFFEHPGQDFPSGRSWNTETMPRAVASTIKEHRLSGRIFNDFDIGDDLCWTLGSENQHAIDGRVNLFGPDGLRDYKHLLEHPEAFERHVQKYDVQMVLLQWSIPRNQILVRWLNQSGAYSLVHMDARYGLWTRDRTQATAKSNNLVYDLLRLPIPPFDLSTMIRSTENPDALIKELSRVQGPQGEPLASLMTISAYSELAKGTQEKAQRRAYLEQVIEAANRMIQAGETGHLETLYATLRRGQALLSTKKYDAAQADFQEVLKFMDHPEATAGIRTIDALR